MKYKELIEKNLRFIVSMIIVIVLGIVGITFALNYSASAGVNITTAELGASITYLNGSENITSTEELIPINESTTTIDANTTSTNVLKVSFSVLGNSTNPDNTIMDISLNNIDMDCELKDTSFKWKLYKDTALLSEGNFSRTFDIAPNNRMVLTETQEDLPKSITEGDELPVYTLLIYIAENCTGDIASCNSVNAQDRMLGKRFTATMKLELSTGKKKTNTRETGITIDACSYTIIDIPTCNTAIYDGTTKTLVNSGSGFTLVNNTGTNAGNYAVIAKLNSGYKWKDYTISEKVVECSISRRELTITAIDQDVRLSNNGNDLGKTVDFVTADGLVSGHSLSSIYLYTPQYEEGEGVIYASGAKIVDSSSNDVTDNYQINYVNGTAYVQ